MKKILPLLLTFLLYTSFASSSLVGTSTTDVQFNDEAEYYKDGSNISFEQLHEGGVPNPLGGKSADSLYCRKVTINHFYIDNTLSNFPVLVYMSRHANLSTNAQQDGDDISFWSLDNNTQYDHEIEYYDSRTGKLAAWVNIPSVSCNIDTEFWMKYGNATCESQENTSGVWDSHFGGIWHLNDMNASDSTSNNNTGTVIGSPTVTTGKIRRAIDFGSTGNWYGIDLGTDSSIDLSNRDTCTIEFWVYFDVDDEDQMCFVQSQDSHSWNVGLGTFDGDVANKNMKFIHRDDDSSSRDTVDSGSGVSSSWHYYVGTYNNGANDNKSIFYDGEWIAGTTSGINNLRDGPATSTIIGYGGDFGPMDGKMDEVRISTNVRNASWIKATYHTISTVNFLSVQNETDIITPIVLTQLPTSITNTTANLMGDLIHNGGENCSVWFEYEKYEEGEGECAGLVATGTCVKDGRSIFWKTRHSSSSNNKPDWQSGLNYNYWVVSGYLGMNEVGLAMGNFVCYDLIDEENRDYAHSEIQGDGVNGLSTAIHRALGRYDTVGEAARFMAINCTYNGNYQVGIVSSEPGVGAVVSMMNYSGTIYSHVTWVNNTWAHLANVHYCDWVTSGWDANDPNDNNDETIYDMCTDITTNGGINEDYKIDWQEICQRGGKNVSGKEKGTDTFSCNGEIAKGSASVAMIAVSGNSSYDGAANVAFTAFGRQPLVGIFLPLGASYLNSDSDIPSDFRGGGGIEDYVDVKSIYATTGGVVHGNTFYCDRVREVLEYANFNENISFDAYDTFMSTLMTASNTTEVKARLEIFADNNMSLTLTGYMNNFTESGTYENISKMYPHTSGIFNETITGLEPGTAYIVSAWANNSHYLANGSQITFLTRPNAPSNLEVVTYSSTQINLTWTVGEEADRTIIERALSPSWQRGEGTQVYNGTESNYEDTELTAETHYYYQLWSYTETEELHQYSSSFASGDSTTESMPNNPPYTPSNPNPEDHATNVSINVDLSWTGEDPNPGDTVTYDVYFGTTSPPPQVVWGQSGTMYDPGTMNHNTQYYWQIVAWDNHGESTSGPIWGFTTEEESNQPPNTPNQPSGPASGYICISYNYSTFTTDPDNDNVTYGWDWDGDLVVDEWTDWYSSGDTCTVAHSWDDPGTYDVGVKAKDIYDAESGWSDPLTITMENHPPYEPSDPDPPDGATNVTNGISWTGGDPDSCDTVTYDVYFGTASPPPLVVSNQSATTYDPGTMTPNTQYYWKIVAWDNHGEDVEGPIWSFTTMEEPNQPPYVPSNPNPEDGTTDVSINTDLSWTGGDPDPGDTVTYDVYYGTTSPPPQVVWEQSETSYDPGAMNYNTQYFWKIVSWDNHGESTSGPIWDFTTEHQQNNAPSISNVYPENETTDVNRPPAELNVTIGDSDNDAMNIYIIWKNHAGEWITLKQYIEVVNGTYNFTSPEGNDWIWGNTTYNWSVNATDEITWTNETYQYTTNGSRYDINNDVKVNFQDAELVWIHRTSEAPYNGIHDVNGDGQVNFQDAGLTWINRD